MILTLYNSCDPSYKKFWSKGGLYRLHRLNSFSLKTHSLPSLHFCSSCKTNSFKAWISPSLTNTSQFSLPIGLITVFHYYKLLVTLNCPNFPSSLSKLVHFALQQHTLTISNTYIIINPPYWYGGLAVYFNTRPIIPILFFIYSHMVRCAVILYLL